MIYDPFDTKIAMDEHGRLYAPSCWTKDADGNPVPEWSLMQVVDLRGEFRRPEW
jgi:hypothetical protein